MASPRVQYPGCNFEGCANIAIQQGLCVQHFLPKECIVKGCSRVVRKMGLCSRHVVPKEKEPCLIDGCGNVSKRRGYCTKHLKSNPPAKPLSLHPNVLQKMCDLAKQNSSSNNPEHPCIFEGCGNIAIQQGLCAQHLPAGLCNVEGCSNFALKMGLCFRHEPKVPCVVNEPLNSSTNNLGITTLTACKRPNAKVGIVFTMANEVVILSRILPDSIFSRHQLLFHGDGILLEGSEVLAVNNAPVRDSQHAAEMVARAGEEVRLTVKCNSTVRAREGESNLLTYAPATNMGVAAARQDHQELNEPPRLSIEPCSIKQIEDHVSLLQSEVDEYQDLINVKKAEIDHAKLRIEYLKSLPEYVSPSTRGQNLLLMSKEDLAKTIAESIEAKFGSEEYRGGSNIQHALEELKDDIVGKIENGRSDILNGEFDSSDLPGQQQSRLDSSRSNQTQHDSAEGEVEEEHDAHEDTGVSAVSKNMGNRTLKKRQKDNPISPSYTPKAKRKKDNRNVTTLTLPIYQNWLLSNQAGPLPAVNNAQLSLHVKDLHTLWMEYIFGLNGMKAARLFTREERNLRANKQRYYRRNNIWKLMVKLANDGSTPEQAIDKIYTIYGRETSVTRISEKIAADRQRYVDSGGYHPDFGLSDD